MGNDLLMGRLDLTPILDAHVRRLSTYLMNFSLLDVELAAYLRSVVHRDIGLRVVPPHHCVQARSA